MGRCRVGRNGWTMRRLTLVLALAAPLLVGARPVENSGSLQGAPVWRQVRIIQRFSIRIAPGIAPLPQAQIEEWQDEERIAGPDARRGGKCVPINAIAAVQPGDGDELLLFLHNQRVVVAKLGRRCNAQDFYSGFYVMRNADGAICAGRDILQARSGANCRVKRLNEAQPAGFRRFP